MRKRSKGAGSSPLTRGKRSVTVPVNITARLIPAHAGKTLFPPFRSATRAAHPRSRGENVQVTGAALDPKGSSPLTRGKQAVDWRGGSARGLIPAHAGKTRAPERQGPAGPAHPRSRGENDGQAAHHCVRAGSSPLTRGKRDVGQHVTFLSGLIPAHAGKTWTWPGRNPRPTAHPRSRGENCCMARLMFSAPGSSPLTRGKLLERFWNAMLRGLIPAHAGKTLVRTHVTMRESAHPRSRGENRETGRIRVRSLGSSPLTRGKLPPRSARGRRRGLIPAHAGKTCFRRSVWRRGPAHPRSRGENLFSPFSLATRAGSSPLTRGKRPGCARSRMARRLIPAHAGKTRPIFLYRTPMRAHPRSRGENASFCGRRRLSRGSSPLTRGKPCSMCRRASSVGLIPAHAGKTHAKPGYPKTAEAHPRSRGENTTTAAHPASTGGSSPLTRGKPALTAFAPATPRLIPAHAGKTFIWSAPDLKTAAHPRSRGENTARSRPANRCNGSSPLTRGKRTSTWDQVGGTGLIPAHAGKTRAAR